MPPVGYKGFLQYRIATFYGCVILFWNFRYVAVAGFFLAYGGVGGINRKRTGHHRPVSGRHNFAL